MNVVYTDEELIEMVRSGNRIREDRALTWFYRQCHPEVCTWLMQRGLPTMVDASDVFQYGLMALYRMIQSPQFELTQSASLKTLLFTICKNRRKNEWRSHFRQEKMKEGMPDFEEETNDIIQATILQERNQFVADLINRLSERCKRLLRGFYYDKKKHEEIAKFMNFKTAQQSRNAMLKCRKNLNRLIIEQPNWREWINE